jgi:hypothetical protein
MIPPLSLLALISGVRDGYLYTSEQQVRCRSEIAAMQRLEAASDIPVVDREPRFAEASSVLLGCLKEVDSHPFEPYQIEARRACPCHIETVEWVDEEAAVCRHEIEEYFRNKALPRSEFVRGAFLADVRFCLMNYRAALARQPAAPAPEQQPITVVAALAKDERAPEPPPLRRPTRAEMEAARARRAEREAKRIEREAKDRELAAAVAKASEAFCGPAPERRAWNGIYMGLERAFKEIANDPDSIDFVSCTELAKKNPPACWITACDVRGKNIFGAKILRSMAFSKNHLGWRTVNVK